MSRGRWRTRAIVERPEEVETALGGRETTWVEAGVVWFETLSRGLNERPTGEARAWGQPRLIETQQAGARSHPAVARGVRLSTRDGAWRVVAVEADRPGPGRCVMHLRRDG